MVKSFYMRLMIVFLYFSGLATAQTVESIRVKDLVEKYRATDGVVVVNFWSTWCKPCVEEIPHFVEITNRYKTQGVQFWMVSQDTEELYRSGQLKNFISKKGWKPTKLYWLNETDADYYCPLIDSSWSGVIPATLVYNKKRKYAQFYESPLTKSELEVAIGKAL